MKISSLTAVFASFLFLGSSAGYAGMAKGMNFNFFGVNLDLVADCMTKGSGITIYNTPRLTRYGEVTVRDTSRKELKELAADGADWIRTLVFFAPRTMAPMVFVLGQDNGRAAQNLASMGRDIARAGISNWVIAFAPQGTASPRCFRESWGDCFDITTVSQSIAFTLKLRDGLSQTPHANLWVDLSNEACPPPYTQSTARLIANHRAYLVPLLRAYSAEFPEDRFSVSCIGDTNIEARLTSIREIFEEAGVSPGFYDAHFYERASGTIATNVESFMKSVDQSGKPSIIGEMQISRPDLLAQVDAGLTAAANPPSATLYWPLRDQQTKCISDHPESLRYTPIDG